MFSNNVVDIKNRVGRLCSDQGYTLTSDTNYIDAINEAQIILCELLRTFVTTNQLSSINRTQAYALPENFMALYSPDDSVSYTNSSGNKTYLDESTYDEMREYDDLTTKTGTPTTFWIDGDNIKFYPIPDYDGTSNITVEHYYYVEDLDGGSSISSRIHTTAINYTIDTAYDIILCNGTLTVTLPDATTNNGYEVTIKNINTGTVTISPVSSQTIDGDSIRYLTSQWQLLKIVSNGTNWTVLEE